MQMAYHDGYSLAFLKRLEGIADTAGIRPGKVLSLWQDYEEDPARNQSLAPTVEEFVKDYAKFLKAPPPPVKIPVVCLNAGTKIAPKFIRELFHPSARDWLRWIRFRRKVIALGKEGFTPLYDYFIACAKDRRVSTCGSSRSGLYPGSSSSGLTLEMFEWATFSMRDSFQGTDISVSVDTHDGDLRTIASANDF